MTEPYIRHLVADMDESMVQRCLNCGKILCDYRNAAWPKDQVPPRGYPAGEIFIQKTSYGSNSWCGEYFPDGEEFKNCNDI